MLWSAMWGSKEDAVSHIDQFIEHVHQVLDQKELLCAEVVGFDRSPDSANHSLCNSSISVQACAYCGDGVCVRHSVPCYQCAEWLHESCILEHAKETGHQVNI